MPRHIRGLFLGETALNSKSIREKPANNNKEYGQKPANSAYVPLFHGHINSSGLVVAYGNSRARMDK